MIHVVFFLAQRAACLEQRWCRTEQVSEQQTLPVDSRPFHWTAVPSRVSAVAQRKEAINDAAVAAATLLLPLPHYRWHTVWCLLGSSRVAPRPSKTEELFSSMKANISFLLLCVVWWGWWSEGNMLQSWSWTEKQLISFSWSFEKASLFFVRDEASFF